jgi:hypothetical protein
MTDSVETSMIEREPVSPNVPDLLKVSPMDTTTATDVETSVLDPVIINQTTCRFVLSNKGILHSHSKITLGLDSPGVDDRFFAPNIGIAQIVQRCRLMVGTKVLQEIDGYNYLTAYKSMFISNEHQKQRELYQSGRCISHEFLLANRASTNGGPDNDTRSVGYGLSNGRNYYDFTNPEDLRIPDWSLIDNEPIYQIALSDLFPMLKQTQLPLYMMKEQVSIELTFCPALERAQSASGVTSASFDIEPTAFKLIADYIYYPQELMDAYASQNRVINIDHFDYRHSKVSVSSTTASSTQIRNLGGANRIVTKVITGVQPSGALQNSILGEYCAMCPEVDYVIGDGAGSNGVTTYNVKYNDRFLYPIDVVNNARHFHNTAQAEGIPPMVTREEYSAEGCGIAPGYEFMGYEQDEGTLSGATTGRGILGRFGWQSFRLNRNERVNSRGLELYYKFATLSTEAPYIQRSWLELAKRTTLIDGFVATNLM